MVTQIVHNGFHGYTTLTIRPIRIETRIEDDRTGETRQATYAVVSARTARRLNREVCGMASCRCGEHVCDLEDLNGRPLTECLVPLDGEIRGHYPQ